MGNSLAIRLPVALVEALGLKEGDVLEIHVAGSRVLEVARVPNARELLAWLPATFTFDRLERVSDSIVSQRGRHFGGADVSHFQ
jgi:antitoxin MazE